MSQTRGPPGPCGVKDHIKSEMSSESKSSLHVCLSRVDSLVWISQGNVILRTDLRYMPD